MLHKKKQAVSEKEEQKKIEQSIVSNEKEERSELLNEPQERNDEQLAKEYLNVLQRVQADFENYKKRQQDMQKQLGGYLIEKLVLDIIPVLDNFRSATQHVPLEQKDNAWVVGIQYIEKQLETVLTDNGMQTIEVKEGETFDPKIHEAISKEQSAVMSEQKVEENEEDKPAEKIKGHTVTKVVQKGYKFGNRVIRAAKVIVK